MSILNEKLKIETWPIERLVEYARNPRKNDEQVERMKAAIKEFGFRIPLVAKSDGTLIDGHLRLKAARALGLTEVPVALADELTDTQVKAFRLLANQSANWASWDNDLLKLEIEELEADGFDCEMIGFDEETLEALGDAELAGAQEGEDDVPEVQEKATTRKGDVWLLGEHRLMCGSSTNAEDVAALMNGSTAEVCITSPPYGASESAKLRDHYQRGADKRQTFYDEHGDNADEWRALMNGFFGIAKDVSKSQFINVQMLAGNKRDLIGFLGDNASRLADVMIWDKSHGAPQMQANVLNNAFEFVLVFSGEGATRAMPFSDFHGDKDNIIRIGHGQNEFADVHRAVFPVEFPQELLRIASNAQTIYEPFSGTGTTMIACETERRKCFAMELSQRYVDVAVRRWQNFTGKEAVLEATGQTFAKLEEERA